MTAVYPAAARVFAPWKNGGGETAEILAWPEGAGFDDFTLRLSTARVAASGPFSRFDGVTRQIAVIEGGAMELVVAGQSHLLDANAPPLTFAGDAPCHARLIGLALFDFNLMARAPLAPRMTRGPLDASARFALLLADAAGLSRLDLVDLAEAGPALAAALLGQPALMIHLA